MPTPSLKPALLVFAVLVTASASAQFVSGPDTTKNNPRLIAINAAEVRAEKLIARSRQRLREGKLAQAESLALAAVREGDEIDWKDALALGILAEVYLAEGQPGVALATLDELKNGSEPDRSAYVRAICLLRIARPIEAQKILVQAAGDGKETWGGTRSRIRNGGLPLPMDDVDSAAALEATAWLLLSETEPPDGPEKLEDLRAAVRLAPNGVLVHSMLANGLMSRDRFDEAAAEADRVAQLGDKQGAADLRVFIQRHRESFAKRNAAKAGGTKAP